jgi:hypothetical protein
VVESQADDQIHAGLEHCVTPDEPSNLKINDFDSSTQWLILGAHKSLFHFIISEVELKKGDILPVVYCVRQAVRVEEILRSSNERLPRTSPAEIANSAQNFWKDKVL